MSDPFLAEIIMFGSNFAPRGWAFNDGQLLPISSNSALFSLLGTIYGGDGRTTFALPDLRGRAPIHAGNGPGLSNRRLGSKTGEETHVLSTPELPSHAHTASVVANVRLIAEKGAATSNIAEGNLLAATTNSTNAYKPFNSANDERAMAPESTLDAGSSATVFASGGSVPHNNMQPYIVVNFIMALQGTFPSRS